MSRIVGYTFLLIAVLAATGSYYYFLSGFLFPAIEYSDATSWFIFHPWIAVASFLFAQSTVLLGSDTNIGRIPAALNLAYVVSFLLTLSVRSDFPYAVPVIILLALILSFYFASKSPEKIWKVSLWAGIIFVVLYIPLLIGSSNLGS